MNPYLQQILHEITVRIAEQDAKIKMLEDECAALRKQLDDLLD
jgi:hypothetical protein